MNDLQEIKGKKEAWKNELLNGKQGVYRCHNSMACSFLPQRDRCGQFYRSGKSVQVQIKIK